MAFVSDMPVEGNVVFFVSWTIGAFIFWALFNDLRTVEVDEKFLYARKGKIAIAIPFSIVESVKQELILLRYPAIVIKLKIPTRLGLEIKFIPYYIFTLFYRQHPVVKELRSLANLPVN